MLSVKVIKMAIKAFINGVELTGWRDPKTDPPMGTCLVLLKNKSWNYIHSAIYHSNNVNIIGTSFAWDLGDVVGWLPIQYEEVNDNGETIQSN